VGPKSQCSTTTGQRQVRLSLHLLVFQLFFSLSLCSLKVENVREHCHFCNSKASNPKKYLQAYGTDELSLHCVKIAFLLSPGHLLLSPGHPIYPLWFTKGSKSLRSLFHLFHPFHLFCFLLDLHFSLFLSYPCCVVFGK